MSPTSRRAFTLVELLVVLAIIAALAALVFASLAPSREKARQTVCVSHLHQFQKAVAMYAADWDGQEARPGATWQGIGLPPRTYDIGFLKQYGLYRSAVLFCPDFNPVETPEARFLSSYTLPLLSYSVDRHLQDLLTRRGGEAPLVYCEWHAGTRHFERMPTWTHLWFPVLRASGQVEVKKTTANRIGTDQI